MDLRIKQLKAFVKAYVDALNTTYCWKLYTTSPKHGITRVPDTDGSMYRLCRYIPEHNVYTRSDGKIFYRNYKNLLLEIPRKGISADGIVAYIPNYDKPILNILPNELCGGISCIDVVNSCFRDVDELVVSKYNTSFLHNAEELVDYFNQFEYDDTDRPEYIYNTIYNSALDEMDYYDISEYLRFTLCHI